MKRFLGLALASATVAFGLAASPMSAANAELCGGWDGYGGGFRISNGNGFTYLAQRRGPCREARSTGQALTSGERVKVRREARGEFICRGKRTYGYGTNMWYKYETDGKVGWSWAGGTSSPQWQKGKGC